MLRAFGSRSRWLDRVVFTQNRRGSLYIPRLSVDSSHVTFFEKALRLKIRQYLTGSVIWGEVLVIFEDVRLCFDASSAWQILIRVRWKQVNHSRATPFKTGFIRIVSNYKVDLTMITASGCWRYMKTRAIILTSK
jgi:hypothetical protein